MIRVPHSSSCLEDAIEGDEALTDLILDLATVEPLAHLEIATQDAPWSQLARPSGHGVAIGRHFVEAVRNKLDELRSVQDERFGLGLPLLAPSAGTQHRKVARDVVGILRIRPTEGEQIGHRKTLRDECSPEGQITGNDSGCQCTTSNTDTCSPRVDRMFERR